MESAVNFKKLIFREITQYIELDICGVPLNPASAPRIGGQNCSAPSHNPPVCNNSRTSD